ncbi:TPA: phage holin family protein [bacterium]|jgi:putative membrane protein|nr:phage holin family protein [bacterium]
MSFVIRWVITGFSLFVANWILDGIRVVGKESWVVYAIVAFILGFINAIIRPILKFLSCPLIILSLGLFSLVINGFTLWLSSQIATKFFDIGFIVNGFLSAFWGALIISIVSTILSIFVKKELKNSD